MATTGSARPACVGSTLVCVWVWGNKLIPDGGGADNTIDARSWWKIEASGKTTSGAAAAKAASDRGESGHGR